MDLKGFHCLLCSFKGENYYLNINEKKIRFLKQFKGVVIKSVAWDETCSKENTKVNNFNYPQDFLIGTDQGSIHICKLEITNPKPNVYDLVEKIDLRIQLLQTREITNLQVTPPK